jgi:hypothetical protein
VEVVDEYVYRLKMEKIRHGFSVTLYYISNYVSNYNADDIRRNVRRCKVVVCANYTRVRMDTFEGARDDIMGGYTVLVSRWIFTLAPAIPPAA